MRIVATLTLSLVVACSSSASSPSATPAPSLDPGPTPTSMAPIVAAPSPASPWSCAEAFAGRSSLPPLEREAVVEGASRLNADGTLDVAARTNIADGEILNADVEGGEFVGFGISRVAGGCVVARSRQAVSPGRYVVIVGHSPERDLPGRRDTVDAEGFRSLEHRHEIVVGTAAEADAADSARRSRADALLVDVRAIIAAGRAQEPLRGLTGPECGQRHRALDERIQRARVELQAVERTLSEAELAAAGDALVKAFDCVACARPALAHCAAAEQALEGLR